MHNKVFTIIIGLILILILSSCSYLPLVNRYFEYNVIHETGEVGQIWLTLSSDFYQRESLYRVNMQYSPLNGKVMYGEIESLKITSIDSDEEIFSISNLYDSHTRNESNLLDEKIMLGFGEDVLLSEYKDYRVTLNFKIYLNEGILFDEGDMDVIITTDYYEAFMKKGVGLL